LLTITGVTWLLSKMIYKAVLPNCILESSFRVLDWTSTNLPQGHSDVPQFLQAYVEWSPKVGHDRFLVLSFRFVTLLAYMALYLHIIFEYPNKEQNKVNK